MSKTPKPQTAKTPNTDRGVRRPKSKKTPPDPATAKTVNQTNGQPHKKPPASALGATGLPFYPAAEIFPLMSPKERKPLKEDISKYGQQDAIITYQDTVLDGRNRDIACLEIGITPKTE